MVQTHSKLFQNRGHDESVDDNSRLTRQLEREIQCLERQLARLEILHHGLNDKTLATYREMIAARKSMLSELSH